MKKLIINIPKPCHEKWDNMTPESKGRFCLSCQKTVIDFSIMTDAAILKHISNTSNKLCGKFSAEQLDRAMAEQPNRKPNILRYAWNMTIAFFIFSSKATAQTDSVKHPIVNIPVKSSDERNVVLIGKVSVAPIVSKNIIKGKITDTLGNPVGYASIIIKDSRMGVSADGEGNFSINVFDTKFPLVLSVSALSFETKEINIVSQEMHPLVIQLKNMQQHWLGEMVIVSVKKKKKFLPAVFKKKEAPIPVKKIVQPRLTIYPNPSPVLNEVKLELQDLSSGEWQLKMVNASGEFIYGTNINVDEKTQTATIPATYIKTSGLYVIQLTNASGKNTISTKLLVQ